MQINWNRRGTVSKPDYVGGVLIDGKVPIVKDNELLGLILQAWDFFVKTVVPLNPETEWDLIQCHLNFSAGYIKFSVSNGHSNQSSHKGSVSLITGNFLEPWNTAAESAGGDSSAFRKAIYPEQVYYTEKMLKLTSDYAQKNEPSLLGKEIRFTCVGTDKVLIGQIGSSSFYPTSSLEMKPKESLPSANDKVGKWENISDVSGNVIWSCKCKASLDDKGFIEMSVEMWRIFSQHIMPLNQRESWDHIRCEFSLDAERLVLFVAKQPVDCRVDQGSCTLMVGNFGDAWREYEKSEDINLLHAREVALAKLIVKGAKTLIEGDKSHSLSGIEVEFWDFDEELIYKAKLR